MSLKMDHARLQKRHKTWLIETKKIAIAVWELQLNFKSAGKQEKKIFNVWPKDINQARDCQAINLLNFNCRDFIDTLNVN